MSDDTAPLLTLREVARALTVSERAVQRLIVQCCFPRAIGLGGGLRWCQRDVDSYLWLVTRGMFSSPGESPTDLPQSEES